MSTPSELEIATYATRQGREVPRYDDLLIGGRWLRASGSHLIDVRFPHDMSLVALVRGADRHDVDRAVSAARYAFDDGPWPRLRPAERAGIVSEFLALYATHSDELAELITLENGDPITAARRKQRGFLDRARHFVDVAAEFEWETTEPGTEGHRTLVRREPVGVVAAIVPWNSPQLLALVKLIPALLAGCCIVIKPAPETAADGQVLAGILARSAIPEGVVSVLPAGRDVSEYLVAHSGIDKIAFTGSTATGRRIASLAAERFARISLELGGKSAAIVLPDADIGQFATGLMGTSMSNSGQVCASHTRILAPAERYDEVVDAAVQALAKLRVGNPLALETQVGPLASRAQQSKVQSYIDLGLAEGARVAFGGPGLPEGGDFELGCYVKPTIFADVDNQMRIAREEIFGPVLVVIRYGSESEAIGIANDSDFGLSGGVWTADPEHGLEVGRAVRTGRFQVNGALPSLNAPFGGFKMSGIGREYGAIGLAQYTEYKTLAV
jgi:aldehyde dehydrogenase (NAD+)